MKSFHLGIKMLLGALVLVTTLPQAYGLSLNIPTPSFTLPSASLGPTVVATLPANNERVVSSVSEDHWNPIPRVTVLFSDPISTVSSVKNAITVTFLSDNSILSPDYFTATILGNVMYIETTRWYGDQEFLVTLDGTQIKNATTNSVMGNNYSWRFKTAKTYYPHLPSHEESEPTTKLTVKKQSLSPAIEILNNTDSIATYRITIRPDSITSLHNTVVKDVLPPGFSFDSIVGGSVNNGSTVHANGLNQITFTIDGEIDGNHSFYFDYRVKINGQISNGKAVVPAGTYNNISHVKGYFTPAASAIAAYGVNNFRSGTNDSRDDQDNVIITRRTTTLGIPSISPTAAHNNTATSSGGIPTIIATPLATAATSPTATTTDIHHPTIDPLTCLQLNGATGSHFSDTQGIRESSYIDFLNTTVFAANPNIRLVKGYADGSFGAHNTLTRFELTKIALGANCIDYNNQPTPNNHFSDVPHDNSEISLIIGKAYNQGIIQGIGSNFYPNTPVTYGEMVKILVGAGPYFSHGSALVPVTSKLNGITDESFRQFAEYANTMNLIDLESNNSFPQNARPPRKSMAQAATRYILWLKNLPTL